MLTMCQTYFKCFILLNLHKIPMRMFYYCPCFIDEEDEGRPKIEKV